MPHQFVTTAQFADLLGYAPSTIRNTLKDSVLIEGVHYYRSFGRRNKMNSLQSKVDVACRDRDTRRSWPRSRVRGHR